MAQEEQWRATNRFCFCAFLVYCPNTNGLFSSANQLRDGKLNRVTVLKQVIFYTGARK